MFKFDCNPVQSLSQNDRELQNICVRSYQELLCGEENQIRRASFNPAAYGRGAGVGCGLGVGVTLGFGDGVPVGVGVAVTVGVGVGVGVDVEMSSQVSLNFPLLSWPPKTITRPNATS